MLRKKLACAFLYGIGRGYGDYDNDGNLTCSSPLGRELRSIETMEMALSRMSQRKRSDGSGWCAGACFVDYDETDCGSDRHAVP